MFTTEYIVLDIRLRCYYIIHFFSFIDIKNLWRAYSMHGQDTEVSQIDYCVGSDIQNTTIGGGLPFPVGGKIKCIHCL